MESVAGNSLQSPVDPTLASCTPCLTSTLLGDHEDKGDDKDIGKLVGGTRPTAVPSPQHTKNTLFGPFSFVTAPGLHNL